MEERLAPKYWLSWLATIPLGLARLLGGRYSKMVGDFIGNAYYKTNEKRRRIVLQNLRMCFSELDESERITMAQSFFRHLGYSFVDLGRIWWSSKKQLNDIVTCDNIDILNQLKHDNRLVIFQVPHNVATEIGGIYLSQFFNMGCFVKPLKNPVFNHFIERGRKRFGVEVLYRDQGIRAVMRALKCGRWMYLIADEDLGMNGAEMVPFFGHPKATLTTTVGLARATGAVIVPCNTRLDRRQHRYTIQLGTPYEVSKSQPLSEAVIAFNEAAETMVRHDPHQFMWIIKWFKTRADGHPGNVYD